MRRLRSSAGGPGLSGEGGRQLPGYVPVVISQHAELDRCMPFCIARNMARGAWLEWKPGGWLRAKGIREGGG